MLGKVIIILVTFLLRDTLSENEVTFRTPDILTISYIKNSLNFYDDCIEQLKDVGNLISRRVVCEILEWLANDYPPTNFSDMNGIDGYLVTANPCDPDYHNKENLTKNPEQCDDAECNPYGYTKEYVLHVYVNYSSANVYTNDLPFNGIQWSKIKDNTCLSIFDTRASRVYMTVCCNHQVFVTVYRTIFLQTSLYINGKRVSKQAQTELGKFMLSGEKPTKKLKIPNGNLTIANIIIFLKKNEKDLVKLLLANEHGNLAPYGQDLTWNGKV
ncbi:7901_t:CDS:2 [Dentiscutata heterogama]|uniref:7901_t:CDS:1 n=1 Tax=Dentiscutata heterogama TaxID=1316150 RepID=A0ACA9LJG2_9GLOM|nr:7901_t:CDS:2 [Dentiscutata heterogama]